MLRFARLATEVLAPWVWVLTLPLAVAWDATGHRPLPALSWGLLISVTGSLIPMAVIVRGAKRGRWDGHHVTNRAGRRVPLLVAGVSLGLGFVVLLAGGAPAQLIALAASMLASLLVAVAITFGAKFKISLHAAVASAAVVVLALTYGPWTLLLALPAAWVAWSRVALRDHTTPEVLAGLLMGVVVGGGGYWVLLTALR
ncbi:phosphatase PAP2 family protein [Amycolatopsis kentuckyensis]|uniref:phosphatase PAP2 family protein n=1 Tax=Amycolatopsis kentuckyensis TaxID=218823 RepID=UPI000A3BEA10|nr:phosphatase PAP2 family protein [Amycolatopsis kentuckyensis]